MPERSLNHVVNRLVFGGIAFLLAINLGIPFVEAVVMMGEVAIVAMSDLMIAIVLGPFYATEATSTLLGDSIFAFPIMFFTGLVMIRLFFFVADPMFSFDDELGPPMGDDRTDAERVRERAEVDDYLEGEITIEELESRLEDEWEKEGVGVPDPEIETEHEN